MQSFEFHQHQGFPCKEIQECTYVNFLDYIQSNWELELVWPEHHTTHAQFLWELHNASVHARVHLPVREDRQGNCHLRASFAIQWAKEQAVYIRACQLHHEPAPVVAGFVLRGD